MARRDRELTEPGGCRSGRPEPREPSRRPSFFRPYGCEVPLNKLTTVWGYMPRRPWAPGRRNTGVRTAPCGPQELFILPILQSGRPDSNRGPPAPKAGALPDCATPRNPYVTTTYVHHKECRVPSCANLSQFSLGTRTVPGQEGRSARVNEQRQRTTSVNRCTEARPAETVTAPASESNCGKD